MANEVSISNLQRALIRGDLSTLTDKEKLDHFNATCGSMGLNPITKPFDYLKLPGGKEILYATKNCTDQLRKIHNVSLNITAREKIGEVYVVTAKAKLPNGCEDESTGAVSLGSVKGEALANLYMKAETKAKRRVTLSICGMGLLDESEVEDIPGAKMTRDITPPKQTHIPSIENSQTKEASDLSQLNTYDPPPPVGPTPAELEAELRKNKKSKNEFDFLIGYGTYEGKMASEITPESLQRQIDFLYQARERPDFVKLVKHTEFVESAKKYLKANSKPEVAKSP